MVHELRNLVRHTQSVVWGTSGLDHGNPLIEHVLTPNKDRNLSLQCGFATQNSSVKPLKFACFDRLREMLFSA
jgi:hypothetical protein